MQRLDVELLSLSISLVKSLRRNGSEAQAIITLQRNAPSAQGMAPRKREMSQGHKGWRRKERDEGVNNGVEEGETH